jgi:hypothetical protein
MPSPSEESRVQPETDGDRLLMWLRLLGWDVRLEQDGPVHVALARCILGSAEVEVAARGRSRTAAVVRLFEAAVERASALTGSRASRLVA